MSFQKIAREFAGPAATVICASLICTQNLIIRKDMKNDFVAVKSELNEKIQKSQEMLMIDIEAAKVIAVGGAIATIKSLEGREPMMHMKQLERCIITKGKDCNPGNMV